MARKSRGNSRFAALRAKSPIYWVKLVAWFSLVGYVAWLSFIHAVANITWQQNPDMALRFVPDHPLALSRKADEIFAERQDPASLARVEAMAKQSLRGGALNPVAVRLLGYVADVRGDRQRARELMLLSQKISRRDFGTQLWLIEDSVARGDKKQALYHYDIALRTTPSSFPVLLPTLVGALTDPEVRSGLAPYARAAPPWLLSFLNEAITTSQNPADVTDVLLKAGRLPDEEQYIGVSNALLAQLVTKGKYLAFRQYYQSLKTAEPTTLTSARLDRLTTNLRYSRAGWLMIDNPAMGGSFGPFDKQGRTTMLAFAGSGERGELMHKYLMLEPGNYRFSAAYDANESSTDAEIRWDLHCMAVAGNVGKWFVTSPLVQGRSTSQKDFSIGPDCRFQSLTLQLAGGSSQTGMEFTLRSVDIQRGR